MPGALSLAAVDEAVFSVLGQRPGMESAFFTLEQALLKPVYAIYPWSPDVLRERLRRIVHVSRRRSSPAPPEDRPAPTVKPWSAYSVAAGPAIPTSPDRPDEQREGDSTDAYTLEAASYPAMLQEIEHQRQWMREIITDTWIGLAIATGLVGLWLINRPLIRVIALQFAWNPVHAIAVTAAVAVLATVVVLVPIAILFDMVSCSASRSVAKFGWWWSARRRPLRRPPISDNSPSQFETWWSGPAGACRGGEAPSRRTASRPRLVPRDAALAAGADYRRAGPGDARFGPGRLDHHLAALGQRRDGRRATRADQASIRVFQPFFVDLNLPVALTRGDEVTVPVVVYNYLDRPQTVELKLTDGSWFKRLGKAAEKIELAAGEVRNVGYRLRGAKGGPFRAGSLGPRQRRGRRRAAADRSPARRKAGRAGVQRHPPAAGRDRLLGPAAGHRGKRQGDRENLSLQFQPGRRGIGRDLPAALRLFRADLLDHLSQRAGLGLPAAEQARTCPRSRPRPTQYIHLGYQRLLELRGPPAAVSIGSAVRPQIAP